jgi:hypothetical protein
MLTQAPYGTRPSTREAEALLPEAVASAARKPALPASVCLRDNIVIRLRMPADF